jgi:hypothetical protein
VFDICSVALATYFLLNGRLPARPALVAAAGTAFMAAAAAIVVGRYVLHAKGVDVLPCTHACMMKLKANAADSGEAGATADRQLPHACGHQHVNACAPDCGERGTP